jgi:hypothetical protein
VVFTVDAQGGRVFVDGEQTASQAWTGNPGATASQQPVSLGGYPGTASPYLPGMLDEVYIVNRAISATEVSTYYNSIPHARPVVWTGLINASYDNGVLIKTAGCDGCADGGATSQQQLAGAGSYLEFTGTTENRLRIIGLTDNSGISAADIDFGLRLQGSVAEVRENGKYRWDIRFAAGDIFRITVLENSVSYAKNGQVFYNSKQRPGANLRVSSSLVSLHASITNAVLGVE